MSIFEAMEQERRIAALEAEVAALKGERDKYCNATEIWTRTAERRWQKLQAIRQILGTQGDPEAETAAVMDDKGRLAAELAALREDKVRLVEALERICTHSRDADCGDHCSNTCMYCQGRAAIDAATKEAPCPPPTT